MRSIREHALEVGDEFGVSVENDRWALLNSTNQVAEL